MVMQKMEPQGKTSLVMIKEMERILSSLADEDAIKLFMEAEKGIESSTIAIKKLNLTPKKYYVWLKRLMYAGLIRKQGGIYVQTILGRLFDQTGQSLLGAINQKDQLELADKLMRSQNLSLKEKEDILQAISKKEVYGTAGLADILHEVKMITDFDIFIKEVIRTLGMAHNIAYVAANRVDARVTDSVFDAIERGVNLFLLSSEKVLSESTNVLKMILSPSLVKMGLKLLNSSKLNLKVTENLGFSFVIVDGEYGLIELPHPGSEEFFVAFKFNNSVFCGSLEETFKSLYEKAKDDPRMESARKYFSFFK